MSSIDIFKLSDILLQDIDYNYALDELLKLNSGSIKTDDPECHVISGKDLSRTTERLIDIIYRANPTASDNTIILNVKKLVIIYYIFVMALFAIHHKKSFLMPSGLELVIKGPEWDKNISGVGYQAIIMNGSNPRVAIYFIVGAYNSGKNKKIYLEADVNNYDIEDSTMILTCGDEKRDYIRRIKSKLELIDLNLIFDLLQSIYDKLK